MPDVVRVFLCSTFEDLVDERAAVLRALNELKLDHESMEYFGARPHPAIDACLAEVAKSSVLILLLGHRYGSLVPGRAISFTEAEYQEGYRLGKPCLVYMRDESVAVPPRFFESDPVKFPALAAFRAVLNSRHTVARFKAPNDLAEGVRSSIKETVQVVEHQAEIARNDEAAFLRRLQELARSALKDGHDAGQLLSAFGEAIISLDARPLTGKDRMGGRAVVSSSRRPNVFFIYSRTDKALILAVERELNSQGIHVRTEQFVAPGGEREQPAEAEAFVFFASARSLRSPWVRKELDPFMARRVTSSGGSMLIPVLLEDVKLPGVMRDALSIDFRDRDARRVATDIAAALKKRSEEKKRTLQRPRLPP